MAKTEDIKSVASDCASPTGQCKFVVLMTRKQKTTFVQSFVQNA